MSALARKASVQILMRSSAGRSSKLVFTLLDVLGRSDSAMEWTIADSVGSMLGDCTWAGEIASWPSGMIKALNVEMLSACVCLGGVCSAMENPSA